VTHPTIRRARPCRATRGGEAGQVSAFTALIAATLLLFAGLVVDGGLALSARLRALNDAQAAARAGAQALDLTAYRQDGRVVLDPARARALAEAHLAAAGSTGAVTVSGDRVTVTASRTQRMQVFTLVGLDSLSVSGTATAQAQRGIRTPDPP
jgi:Flp pilus assembly protein TadG